MCYLKIYGIYKYEVYLNVYIDAYLVKIINNLILLKIKNVLYLMTGGVNDSRPVSKSSTRLYACS